MRLGNISDFFFGPYGKFHRGTSESYTLYQTVVFFFESSTFVPPPRQLEILGLIFNLYDKFCFTFLYHNVIQSTLAQFYKSFYQVVFVFHKYRLFSMEALEAKKN